MGSGEFIDVLSPEALKNLMAGNAEIVKMIAGVKEVNANMVEIKTPSGSDSAIKKLTADYDAQRVTIQKLQAQLNYLAASNKSVSVSSSRATSTTREQSVAQQILRAETDRNIRANTLLAGAYARASAQLLILKKEAKDAAIAFGEESIQAKKAAQAALELDGRIKSADQAVGDYQRNVGNYSGGLVKGFQSVFSSVRQLAYILPGIGIAGIFSLGAEAVETFFNALFKSEKQLNLLTEALLRFKQAQTDATASTKNELQQYSEYLKIASKLNSKDVEEREKAKIAVDKLRQAYPALLKAYSDEQISKIKGSELDKKIQSALGQREQYKEKQKETEAVNANIEQINAELEAKTQYNKALEKQRDIVAKNTFYGKEGSQIVLAEGKEAQKRIELLQKEEEIRKKIVNNDVITGSSVVVLFKEKLKLEKAYNAALAEQNKLKNESIILEGDGKSQSVIKVKKEKLSLTFSAIKSEYELQKAIIQRQLAEIGDRMNNEQSSLEARLKARQEFSAKSIEILDLEIKEEKALLLEKYNDDLAKNNLAYKNKELSAKQWAENIQILNERFNNEVQTQNSKNSIKFNDLLNQDLAYYKKIQDEKVKFSQSTAKMITDLEIKKYKAIVDNAHGEEYTLEVRQKAFGQVLKLQRAELDLAKIRELANSKSEEETANIIQKYKDLNYEIDNLESPLQKAQKATDDWIKSNDQLGKSLSNIGLSSAKMFLDFDEHGQSTFDKLLEGADTLKEKFAVTFQGIGDIAQEVFNKMSELSNANFENEYANLEKQRDIAIMFAGDSSTAREEIERQYAQRQAQIKRAEFRAKKQEAEFNIFIDTAQGVMNAYAKGNIPLAIAVGIIGALELAMVASRQPPAYEFGTDSHIGGDMIINDQKGSNYKELVETPDGKKRIYEGRNVKVNAPKGTKVKTASETMDYLMFNSDLNNILTGNNISTPKVEVHAPDIDLSPVVNAINNKPEFSQLISNGDLKTVVKKHNQTYELMNKRFNGQRNNV